MDWLSTSVRNKILAIFALGIGVVALAGFFGYVVARMGFAEMVHINQTQTANATSIQTAQEVFKEQVQEWKNVLLRGYDPQALEKYWKQFVERETDVRELTGKLQRGVRSEKARDLLGQFVSAHEEMGQQYRAGLEAFKQSGFDPRKGDAAVKGVDRVPTQLLGDAAKLVRGDADGAVSAVQADVSGKLNLILVVAGTAIVVAVLGSALLLSRLVVSPLGAAVEVANAVARGDLTVRLESDSTDELGELLRALANMRDDLVSSVSRIRASAESVGTASKQIATGNAELSSRTEEQASSLEETASSMEELMTTVKLNADSAKQANQLAAGASEAAGESGQVVGEVVSTMEGIAEASMKIADIIGVIDGIAFQTNILALNAAVEAARAGEQGRGFAVVAAEVRSLAQRSAAAAKEIRDLIQTSVERVESGTTLVGGAGKKMADLVASIKRVSDVVSEIAAASQEQLSGIEQVSRAVTQMDQVVQQNAALVEESASASESMSSQAEQLIEAVARFNLGGKGAADAEPGVAHGEARTLVPARPAATRAKRLVGRGAELSAHAAGRAGREMRTPEGDWKSF